MTNSGGEAAFGPEAHYSVSPIDPDTPIEYLNARRRLLGPTADITHPDFGRDNTDEETFALKYDVIHPNGNHHSISVTQHIFDGDGREISQADLEADTQSLQIGEAPQDWIEVAESG